VRRKRKVKREEKQKWNESFFKIKHVFFLAPFQPHTETRTHYTLLNILTVTCANAHGRSLVPYFQPLSHTHTHTHTHTYTHTHTHTHTADAEAGRCFLVSLTRGFSRATLPRFTLSSGCKSSNHYLQPRGLRDRQDRLRSARYRQNLRVHETRVHERGINANPFSIGGTDVSVESWPKLCETSVDGDC